MSLFIQFNIKIIQYNTQNFLRCVHLVASELNIDSIRDSREFVTLPNEICTSVGLDCKQLKHINNIWTQGNGSRRLREAGYGQVFAWI